MENTADPEGSCFICDAFEKPIHKHHIIPRRHDGPDHEDNLVALCEDCHFNVERMYDKAFWEIVESKFRARYKAKIAELQVKLKSQRGENGRTSIAKEQRISELQREAEELKNW